MGNGNMVRPSLVIMGLWAFLTLGLCPPAARCRTTVARSQSANRCMAGTTGTWLPHTRRRSGSKAIRFRDRRRRAGHKEAPTERDPRLARRFGRSTGRARSCSSAPACTPIALE
jgi:hypothetical protein